MDSMQQSDLILRRWRRESQFHLNHPDAIRSYLQLLVNNLFVSLFSRLSDQFERPWPGTCALQVFAIPAYKNSARHDAKGSVLQA
jgi:hypothetical protein